MTNRKLDLLLINPGNRSQVFQSLAADLAAIEPPVWAGLIATFIRAGGFAVQIVDAEAEGLSFDETACRVVDMEPTLTAVIVYGHQPSASTQNMPAAGGVCEMVKEKTPHLKTIFVGGDGGALPGRNVLEEGGGFSCGGGGRH